MARLYDQASGRLLGEITAADIDFLRAELEEESGEDQDYWIDDATIAYLAEKEAPAALLNLLREAVAGTEGLEVRWEDVAS